MSNALTTSFGIPVADNQNSLTAGQDLTNQDFVNVELGSISGHKLEDADGNLATTGDQTPVENWTIMPGQCLRTPSCTAP